jgi:hypothetical protein
MSPQAGEMLMGQIVPRLRSAIPRNVTKVGAEDEEELVQDAIATAAQMLDAVERNGKEVTPGNIAFYTILHMKSGRRSQCRSRADVMAQGTQLDRKASVLSLEEEVGYDPELDEAVTLGDHLASHHEDPAMAAGRNIDWELFMATHDYRYGIIIKGFAQGKALVDTAKDCGAGYSRLSQLRQQMVQDLLAFLGEDPIADAAKIPAWRAGILADREHAACQADRRRK